MSKTVDVYLVRHGEAQVPWSKGGNSGLSKTGKQQAEQVATRLLNLSQPQLISSPLRRAKETGYPLGRQLGIQMSVEDRFCEVPLSTDLKIRKDWLQSVSTMRWHQVDESISRWRSNAWAALIELRRDTVVFTHFMLINALVSRATANDGLVYFEPGYGSITHLRIYNDDRCELMSIGQSIAVSS